MTFSLAPWSALISSATGLISSPTPGILIVTVSPAFSGPMPDGVPVAIMSPGSSVITLEMNATR